MVDYSKFDRVAADLSDSDDDPPRPIVTKMDGPASVTFGGAGRGGIVAPRAAGSAPTVTKSATRANGVDYSRWDQFGADCDSDSVDDEDVGTAAALPTQQAAHAQAPAIESCGNSDEAQSATTAPTSSRDRTLSTRILDLTRNGGEHKQFYWRQDREEVVLTIPVASGAPSLRNLCLAVLKPLWC